MNEYDAALKSVLTHLTSRALAEITGFAVTRWHNVELPAVRHRRADLLGETTDGRLFHLELQSTNRSDMARRMLEYSLAIRRKFGRYPEQLVLYVGNSPLRMKTRGRGPKLEFECAMVDIRDFDTEPLLASPCLEDNVIAVLTRTGNERVALRRILERIALSSPAERSSALSELMTLSGLRKAGPVIEREIEQMPLLDDIMDHAVLGRERKRGIALGKRDLILGLVAKRFGAVPDWTKQRLESLNSDELEPIALRILDAQSIEDLFA